MKSFRSVSNTGIFFLSSLSLLLVFSPIADDIGFSKKKKEKERSKEMENIFEVIMVESFPNLKEIVHQYRGFQTR